MFGCLIDWRISCSSLESGCPIVHIYQHRTSYGRRYHFVIKSNIWGVVNILFFVTLSSPNHTVSSMDWFDNFGWTASAQFQKSYTHIQFSLSLHFYLLCLLLNSCDGNDATPATCSSTSLNMCMQASQNVIDEAVDQLKKKRLRACVKVKGHHFEHLL